MRVFAAGWALGVLTTLLILVIIGVVSGGLIR